MKLDGLMRLFVSDCELFKLLELFVGRLFSPILLELGMECKEFLAENLRELHTLCISTLGIYGNKDVIIYSQNLFNSGIGNIPAEIRGPVMNICVKNGDIATYETVLEYYKHANLSDQKEIALSALGFSKNIHLLQRLLEYTLDMKVVSQQDIPRVFASVSNNPIGKKMVWDHLQRNWDNYCKVINDDDSAILRYMIKISTRLDTLGDLESVKKFFENKSVRAYNMVISQAIENIEVNSRWRERDGVIIREWLEKKRL